MKIKYKLILIFVMVILAATLPLSLFILNQQEKQKLEIVTRQGEINGRVLARTVLNILLMNGGDVRSSMVDAKDMISMLAPMSDEGLIYADVILASSREQYNGRILARYIDRRVVRSSAESDTVPAGEMEKLKARTGHREISFPGVDDVCYEFVSTESLHGMAAACVGRLVFSKSVVLAPIRRLRWLIYAAIAAALFLVGLLGLFLSSYVSRPIEGLIAGVEKIGGGDFEYRLPVTTGDELGILATTFNHMAQIVKLEIDQLVTANEELKRLDVLKNEFLANMSHEIRTPLSGIIGIAESLSAGAAGPVTEESVHDLSLIVSSGRRLAGLVNDILDFSKLRHRDIVLSRTPVNLYSLAELVREIMLPLARKKSITIRNLIDPDSAIVDGDENRLQQILLNLVGNAVKFTDSGGITLSAERDSEGMLVVAIDDTGIGVPPDKAGIIFETFEQADGSIARAYGGTGLGLSIAKKLVELHGGRIWVEPGRERGSRFSFTVPVAHEKTDAAGGPEALLFAGDRVDDFRGAAPEEVRPVSRAAAGDGGERKRILVVDDEPVNLQVMMNYLDLDGYEVDTAASGAEALEKLAEQPADLVLLDVMLPRISGYEVCRTIREKRSFYELPVLMLTARNRPGDIVTGLEAGANDYITKPVDRRELLARVRALISLKSSVKLNNELSLIKRDIQIAHEIQKSILTQELPVIDGVAIALRYEPMTDLGGDFYDVQLVGPNLLGVLLADVSGHGIPAAFICAMLKVAYSFHRHDAGDPSVLLRKIGETMFNYVGGQFITACYACIDLAGKKVRHANAGHWPPIIWRKGDGTMITDSENRMPIGWVIEEEYPVTESELVPGDRLVLYTDGIIEARDAGKQMFGETRFHDLIRSSGMRAAREFVDDVVAAVDVWTGRETERILNDDVTIVVIDILE
ncbi:MAG: SpoIIE family protein phosphatase [Spirochaetes bacterium]|nr:SpoIIE family protein phosphatase [Spirochaetota bacterium]